LSVLVGDSSGCDHFAPPARFWGGRIGKGFDKRVGLGCLWERGCRCSGASSGGGRALGFESSGHCLDWLGRVMLFGVVFTISGKKVKCLAVW